MTEAPPQPGTLAYAAPAWLVATLAAAACLLAAIAASTSGAERFLFTVPALATGVEAVRTAAFRPWLRAGEDGIEVVRGWRREWHPWSAVVSVGALAPPSSGGRLRRSGNALEIDLGEHLLVIPGYRLGVPVAQVAAGMTSAKFSASRGSGGC